MSTSDMARRQGDVSPLHMPMPMSSNPPSRMSAAASRINGTGGFAGYQMGSGSGGIMSSLMGGHSQPGGGIGGAMANRSASANTASTTATAAGRRPMRQARSTPIAIIRNRDDDSDEASGDSIHSDSDDDGSSVDVERDALRIRRRYQKKLGAQAASELPASPSASININTNLWGQSKSLNTNTNNGMLRAPYLGSMRQTEDYVAHHDMPPMSLSSDAFTQYQGQRQSGGEMTDDDGHNHNHNHNHHSGQALEAVGETGANGAAYGSLRESHQQGRFLDGPASYRDPASGQIRQLQSRAQFIHGSLPNTISLRDRIQQSTKLRNIQRQKQAHLNASMPTQRAEETNDVMNNVDDDQQQNQHQHQLQKPGISSLSAMMSKAGKPSRKDDADTEPSDYSGDSETEEHRHIHSTIKRVDSNPYDNDFGQKSDSSPGDLDGMLSTSMTAFEMLREVKANSERAASILHRHHHNYQRQAVGGGSNNDGNDNVSNSHNNNDDTNTTNKNISMSTLLCPSSSSSSSNKPDFSQDTRFKELSRSLSDPTPHLRSYRTIMGNLMQSHRSPPAAVMSQQPPIQSMQQLQLNAAASQHVSSTTIHQSTNTAGRINATSNTNQQQYGVFGSISYQQNNSPQHNTLQEQQMMTNREYHASYNNNNSGTIDNDEHFDLEME